MADLKPKTAPKIITEHVYPPIPVRSYDWSAHYDGHEENGFVGWGETEAAAIHNLELQSADEPMRCKTGLVANDGSCIHCYAWQGERCRS